MTLATAVPLADAWGMHGDVGTGWWVVMVAGMVVFWGVVILIGARLLRGSFSPRQASAPPAETPTAVLDRRLAEGAITVEEYEQRRRALTEPARADTPAVGQPLAGAAAQAGVASGDDDEGRR